MSLINMIQTYAKKFLPLHTIIKQKAANLTRGIEKGIVNRRSKSSLSMREDGHINAVSSKYAQTKLGTNKNSTLGMQDVSISNTKKVFADELILNGHKFNNNMYEYADLKEVNSNKERLVSGVSMQTTVMTKSWEPTLERYVMIRRPARMAMFSPKNNVADVPENLSIDTEIEKEFKNMVDIEEAASKFNEMMDADGGK